MSVALLILEIVIMIYVLLLFQIISLFVIGPLVAKSLTNKPYQSIIDDDGKKIILPDSTIDGFFTTIQPGQVKIIERAERFVRCIMRWPGYTFKMNIPGNLNLSEEDKWEVEKSDSNDQDAYPVEKNCFERPTSWITMPFWLHRSLWRLWKVYMYHYFGYVFTGIRPWQTIRTYPIEYFIGSSSKEGTYLLEQVSNRSDHYRVAEFYFPFPMDSADTANMIPAKLAVGLTTKVANPYKLAYKTDQAWSNRYISIARSEVNDQTRIRRIQEIIGGGSSSQDNGNHSEKTERVNQELAKIYQDIKAGINAKVKEFGLKLKYVDTPSRKTANPDDIKTLGAAGFAAVAGEARVIEAEKEAEALSLVATSIRTGEEPGVLAAQLEARIRTVKSAGNRAIISVGDNSRTTSETDQMLKAILAEQRRDRND